MNPSLQLLLHGDPSLSLEINIKIFESVHKYLIATKRF